uniref:Epidermal growth factor-like domain-containing protein n=1 Tax=Corethron hystrix TaxID=216773 RepID=A0A7S1C085_9STRA|mmetsp:Transcript_6284/g.13608  ORF Transcript_6284/g.13608 Transcript_6284/m.13608 type:complete len:118 (+) Transcript_6284:101-454(+)
MRSLALENKASDGSPSPQTYGSDPNNAATWDFDRIFGCICDEGWGGYDCSLRLCVTGLDPLDTGGPAHECSNHGKCDRLTGKCKCFQNWGSSDGMGSSGTIEDCGFRMPFPYFWTYL